MKLMKSKAQICKSSPVFVNSSTKIDKLMANKPITCQIIKSKRVSLILSNFYKLTKIYFRISLGSIKIIFK